MIKLFDALSSLFEMRGNDFDNHIKTHHIITHHIIGVLGSVLTQIIDICKKARHGSFVKQ